MKMDMSRRGLLQMGLGGLATATLLPGSPALARTTGVAAAQARFYGDPGPGRLYYGASYEGDLSAWEHRMGQRLALHRTYYLASQADKLVAVARHDLARRRLPHVSTKCPGTWAQVAAGKHDRWLHGLAKGLDHLHRPLFFTVHHEPENDVRSGQRPDDFVNMQEHVIKMFAGRAPRVTVVPVLQGWSFSAYNRSAHPDHWYVPSCQVYGVDVYNPYSSKDNTWVSFADKLASIRPHAHGKPIAVGEYGCRNDGSKPSRAAEWMRDAFSHARRHDVVSLSYFNSSRNSPEGTWALKGERARVFQHRLSSSRVARPRAL